MNSIKMSWVGFSTNPMFRNLHYYCLLCQLFILLRPFAVFVWAFTVTTPAFTFTILESLVSAVGVGACSSLSAISLICYWFRSNTKNVYQDQRQVFWYLVATTFIPFIYVYVYNNCQKGGKSSWLIFMLVINFIIYND